MTTTTAPARRAVQAERRGRRRINARRIPWWFIMPAAVIYLFAVLWPSIQGMGFAFTDWNGLSPEKNFIWFDNFIRVVNDPAARNGILHTVLIAIGVTIIQNLIGLLLALGVNTRIKSRNVLRVALFAPAIITPVATAFLWKFLLGPTGSVNEILNSLGLGVLAQNWLGDPDVALWAIVGVVVWQFSGYSMVIFLAGLQGVPEEVLEASRVDGAGPWRRFWYVVRPELAPAITINLMLSMIGGLKLFDQVWVMTNGGPGTATETISTLIYKNAFQFSDFSYGIAMAVVLTIFVAILSGAQYFGLGRQRGNK